VKCVSLLRRAAMGPFLVSPAGLFLLFYWSRLLAWWGWIGTLAQAYRPRGFERGGLMTSAGCRGGFAVPRGDGVLDADVNRCHHCVS